MSENKNETRRGVNTSEFWLSAITSALSLAIMGGWVQLDGAGTADKIAAIVVMALSSVGYTVGRSWAKGKEAEAGLD